MEFNDWTKEESAPERRTRKRNSILTIALFCLMVGAAVVFSILSRLHAALTPEPTPSPEQANALTAESGVLTVTFLDVGQGDCVFLRSPNGKTMLVDAGPADAFDTVYAYLESQKIAGLDMVVCSHLHADHIGSMARIVGVYAVGSFYLPPFDAESATYFNLLDALNENHIETQSPLADVNALLPWDESCEVRVLSPYGVTYDDFNDTSYILRVSYGATAVLLTGDATTLSEKLMCKALPNRLIRANILKVGHHGSGDSTSNKLLNAVNPTYAVISVGENNGYGLPDESTINRLTEHGITIYRTDRDKSVTFVLDGTNVTVLE